MKEMLTDVIALQDVEVQIYKAEGKLNELPIAIDEINSIIQARKQALDAVDNEILDINQRREPLEVELKENQTILDAADARIKKIKTNKEFLALQREIDIAKKRKIDIEEQLIGLMEKIESRNAERERILKAFEADRSVLDVKMDSIMAEKKELEDFIASLRSNIDKLREEVDPSLLSKYDRIKEKRKGLVVVECMDGVCGGCHMHIPPQLYNELVRADKLIICPVCQRILFYNPDNDAKADTNKNTKKK